MDRRPFFPSKRGKRAILSFVALPITVILPPDALLRHAKEGKGHQIRREIMDLVGTAENPVPSGALPGSFEGKNRIKIRYALWPHGGEKRRGTVCLFGGRTEYIEKYFEVIADLRRRGFAVATMDWRGQGGSGRMLKNPLKGHVRSFADFDADLAKFMKEVVLPDSPPPFYALAHSMGGHILLRSARMRNSWFDRIVLSAPMIWLAKASLPTSQESIHKVAELACAFGLSKKYVPNGRDEIWENESFEGNPLTSDRYRYERNIGVMRAAPHLKLGSPTMGWMRAACRSMNEVTSEAFPASVQVPLLLVGAGSDTVVSTRIMEELSVRLKVGSEIIIPGARHEILQEREDIRQQFWAAFDAYLPS